jgi:hypothetical protein
MQQFALGLTQNAYLCTPANIFRQVSVIIQGGSNMTGTNCDFLHTNSPGHI